MSILGMSTVEFIFGAASAVSAIEGGVNIGLNIHNSNQLKNIKSDTQYIKTEMLTSSDANKIASDMTANFGRLADTVNYASIGHPVAFDHGRMVPANVADMQNRYNNVVNPQSEFCTELRKILNEFKGEVTPAPQAAPITPIAQPTSAAPAVTNNYNMAPAPAATNTAQENDNSDIVEIIKQLNDTVKTMSTRLDNLENEKKQS